MPPPAQNDPVATAIVTALACGVATVFLASIGLALIAGLGGHQMAPMFACLAFHAALYAGSAAVVHRASARAWPGGRARWILTGCYLLAEAVLAMPLTIGTLLAFNR